MGGKTLVFHTDEGWTPGGGGCCGVKRVALDEGWAGVGRLSGPSL